MNTRAEDREQAEFLRRWQDDHRDPRHVRWFVFAILGACFIAMAVMAAGAQAATVQLTCKPPTHNTDNTPITGAISYRFYGGAQPVNASTCAATITVVDPAPGSSITYPFQVTAIVAGIESAKSNTATKTITTPLPTPNPPTLLLTIGGDVNVASPNYSNFSWKLGARAGTIVAGIKCDASRRIGDSYYRVTGPVVWANGKKDYVVARCEKKA